MVNGLRGTRAPFCVAGAALGAPGAAFAWQVQHLESLDAACGQRSPRGPRTFLRGRCSTWCTGGCFCVAGAALREPGRCLWSTVSAGPRTILRGRCSTWCTGGCFCVAGAALREPGRCLWSTVSAGPRTHFAWQVQHLVHRRLLLRGRCST